MINIDYIQGVITMHKVPCLNLAEVMNGIYEKDGTLLIAFKDILKESGYTRFSRIYIGSSFCTPYFLHLNEALIKALCLLCEKERIKYTLVVPMFTQRYLEQGKQLIQKIVELSNGYLDEITVNDYGMMEYIHSNYKQRINLGRLFAKDYREKRYGIYFSMTIKPKIFNSIMKEFVRRYQIYGLELDLTSQKIDLEEAFENLVVGFHYPYCYQTVGNICEIGSTNLPLEQKFRANHKCEMECEHQIIHYEAAEGGHYIKHGRAVFFENKDCEIIHGNEIRLIYAPKYMEESYGHISTLK